MSHDVQSGSARGAGATRAAILRTLREAGAPLPVEGVAAAVGLRVSGTRWHLDRLVAAGAVRTSRVRAVSRGRPRVLYRAAPAAEVDEVEPYRMLAGLLAARLDAGEADPAQLAGRAWAASVTGGPDLHGMRATVTRLLDETGFRPRPGPDPADIELGACPFFDVASSHPKVVCDVHAAMLRGAVEQLGAPPEDVTLIAVLDRQAPCRVRVRDRPDG